MRKDWTHLYRQLYSQLISTASSDTTAFIIIIIVVVVVVVVVIIIIIIIITELTHSKTILEITVEIELQPAALDFKNLSQYSSRSK